MTDTSAPPAAPPNPATVADLAARLDGLMTVDVAASAAWLDGLRRMADKGKRAGALADLAIQIDRAQLKVDQRARVVPQITFPPELPVSERADDLAEAIRDHQVVIVAGETGSGKSTQLPKICLSIGRGVRGLIGHTQPRRIAARALAERIAEETGTELGEAIGYTIRFGDHTGPNHFGEADDRRHPRLAEIGAGPRSAELRHDHHRRGARAEFEH